MNSMNPRFYDRQLDFSGNYRCWMQIWFKSRFKSTCNIDNCPLLQLSRLENVKSTMTLEMMTLFEASWSTLTQNSKEIENSHKNETKLSLKQKQNKTKLTGLLLLKSGAENLLEALETWMSLCIFGIEIG